MWCWFGYGEDKGQVNVMSRCGVIILGVGEGVG